MSKGKIVERHAEQGYTLVEILVVITLSTFVGVLVHTIFIIGQAHFIKWQYRMDINQSASVLLNRISDEVRSARQINEVTINKLMMADANSNDVILEFADGMLFKNKQSYMPSGARFFDVSFQWATDTGYDSSLQMFMPEQNESNSIKISLQAISGNDTLRYQTTIAMRNNPSWH